MLKTDPEQRATWLAAAVASAGTPPIGWLDEMRAQQPRTLIVTSAQFFVLCDEHRQGRVVMFGLGHNKKNQTVVSLGWPDAAVQTELL
jgi:hypothetical protein